MDFGILVYFVEEGLQCTHTSVNALKEKLKKYLAEIDSEIVRATSDQFIPRPSQVIKKKGGYIE